MSNLPNYDVIIWINYNPFGKKLEEDILSSIDIEPYERSEYDGVLDMHWGFKSLDDAMSFSFKLKDFLNNPNLILLKASDINNPNASIVYKDERYKK